MTYPRDNSQVGGYRGIVDCDDSGALVGQLLEQGLDARGGGPMDVQAWAAAGQI